MKQLFAILALYGALAAQVGGQFSGAGALSAPILPQKLICSNVTSACFPDLAGATTKTVKASGGDFSTVESALHGGSKLNCASTSYILAIDTAITTALGVSVSLTTDTPCGAGHHIFIRSSGHANMPPPGTRITSANYTTYLPFMWHIQKTASSNPFLFDVGWAICGNFVGVGGCAGIATSGLVVEDMDMLLVSGNPYIALDIGDPRDTTNLATRIFFDHYIIRAASYSAVQVSNLVVGSAYPLSMTDGLLGLNATLYLGAAPYCTASTSRESHGLNIYSNPGPIKFVNNEVAGALTEPVLFGGAPPASSAQQPYNIEVRQNWIHNDPALLNDTATGACVKNLLEFKGAATLSWVDGNVLDYSRQSINTPFYQHGAAFDFLISQNCDGNTPCCPQCQLRDMTFTHNIIRHTAGWSTEGHYFISNGVGQYPATARLLLQQNLWADTNCNVWNTPCSQPSTGAWMFIGSGMDYAGSPEWPGPYDLTIDQAFVFGSANNGTFTTWINNPQVRSGFGGSCSHADSPGASFPSLRWTNSFVVTDGAGAGLGSFEGDYGFQPVCLKDFGVFPSSVVTGNYFFNFTVTSGTACANFWGGAPGLCPPGLASNAAATIEPYAGMTAGSYATCAAGLWANNNPYSCTYGGGTGSVPSNLAALNAIVAAQTLGNDVVLYGIPRTLF